MRKLVILALVLSATCVAASAWAAEPAPLPQTDAVESLRALLEISEADVLRRMNRGELQADRCRVDTGMLSCTCLRGDDARYDVWRRGELTGVAGELGGARVAVSSALAVDVGWALSDVWFEFDERVLHVAEAFLGPEEVRLSEARWYRAPEEQLIEIAACGSAVSAELGPIARAEAATWTAPDGWRLERYRVGPWPVGLSRVLGFGSSRSDGMPADRRASGFLPPTARSSGGESSAVIDFALPFPLTLWFGFPDGAGLGFLSERRGRITKLDAGIDIDANPFAEGDFDVGRRAHLRGHLEHPMSARAWTLRRFENDAFFRDWRATRVGASLSGEAHALQIAGAVTTDPDVPDDRWDGILTYALDVDGGRFARWTVDLEHASERREDTIHSAVASVGWRAPIGWVDSAWLTPGLDLVANYAAVSARRGFDASTTISVLGSVETGLAFEGRLERAVHRIVPTVRVGGELYGEQQRQPEEGAPPYPYTGPNGWRWGVVSLEQSLDQGELRLALPVGLFTDALGGEESDSLASPIPFARMLASLRRITLQVGAACPRSCGSPAYQFGGMVGSRRLTAWYSTSNLSPRTAAVIWADELTRRGHTAIRLIHDPELTTPFTHHAGVRLRHGPASGWVDGRWGVDERSRGLGAGVAWMWDALGWGLSALGGWKPQTDEYSVRVGLALAR